MLFHLTISHGSQDCPGRHPADPPDLVAPSDTREALGRELGVKLHFVLWGASCLLWAQPEHLAFAVLEADDVESVRQYVAALVPNDWSVTALPVWNLPSQLRLIRQVRLAPPMQFGQSLTPADAGEAPSSVVELPSGATDVGRLGAAFRRRPGPSESGQAPPPPGAPSDEPPLKFARPLEPAPPREETDQPGTITRLLRELDKAPEQVAEQGPASAQPSVGETNPSAAVPTRFIDSPTPTPPPPPPAPTARAWLVSIAGPSKGKTYMVLGQAATIGRLPECAIFIPDERLSREHARIAFHDGEYWLSDLNSKNGTALNGSLISTEQALHSGDTIELGGSRLVVTIQPDPAG